MPRERPLDSTPKELAKFGVTVLDLERFWLCCDACGRGWIPRASGRGRLPNGYWKCPNGCRVRIDEAGDELAIAGPRRAGSGGLGL